MVFIDQMINTAMIILGIILVSVITIFIILERQYKHRITIKECTNGSKRILNDKFKIKKDATGVWWKTRKTKALIPENMEAAEVTTRGRLYVEFYLLNGDTYVPAIDTFNPHDKTIVKEIRDVMQPLTTSQRSLHIEQMKKAGRDKKLGLGEIIAKAIPYAVLIIILVCIMIFWGEFMQPAIDATANFEAVSDNLVQVTDRLDSMINNKQIIVSQEGGSYLNNTGVPN